MKSEEYKKLCNSQTPTNNSDTNLRHTSHQFPAIKTNYDEVRWSSNINAWDTVREITLDWDIVKLINYFDSLKLVKLHCRVWKKLLMAWLKLLLFLRNTKVSEGNPDGLRKINVPAFRLEKKKNYRELENNALMIKNQYRFVQKMSFFKWVISLVEVLWRKYIFSEVLDQKVISKLTTWFAN